MKEEKETKEITEEEKTAKALAEQISNSIKPSIAEAERFVCYLNKRFQLGLPDNILINIEMIKPSVKGYFMPKGSSQAYKTKDKVPLNTICLNSLYLVNNPYETIAHETAHYVNETKNIKDCSSNQYHNKNFKKEAERLLLNVSRTNKGYAQTSETPGFVEMIEQFKPDKNAFKVFQGQKDVIQKTESRNLKFVCSCGVIIRSARNNDKPLLATCGYCGGQFEEELLD